MPGLGPSDASASTVTLSITSGRHQGHSRWAGSILEIAQAPILAVKMTLPSRRSANDPRCPPNRNFGLPRTPRDGAESFEQISISKHSGMKL